MKAKTGKSRTDRHRIPNIPIVFRFCRKNRNRKQEKKQEQEQDRNQEEGIPDRIRGSCIYTRKFPRYFPNLYRPNLVLSPQPIARVATLPPRASSGPRCMRCRLLAGAGLRCWACWRAVRCWCWAVDVLLCCAPVSALCVRAVQPEGVPRALYLCAYV